jgi:serine/threonine protein kinase
VAYLHANNVCHRDLKLENVLLDSFHHVRVADFGLARRFSPSELLTTRCGSEEYAAPEIVQGLPYDPVKTDAWSLGVILYALLAGQLPFQPGPGGAVKHMYHRIARGEYKWPKNADVSDKAKELVKGLLQPNPARRYTANDALRHIWLSDISTTFGCTVREVVDRDREAENDEKRRIGG